MRRVHITGVFGPILAYFRGKSAKSLIYIEVIFDIITIIRMLALTFRRERLARVRALYPKTLDRIRYGCPYPSFRLGVNANEGAPPVPRD